MDLGLKQRRVLVSGGSRGIGRAIVQCMAMHLSGQLSFAAIICFACCSRILNNEPKL